MDKSRESSQIVFLHATWRTLLQNQPEPFEKRLLLDFVSADVIQQLPAHTTLLNVLAECREQDAFQESYIKSFISLRKHWERLTPESRLIIVGYIQKCGLQKNSTLQPLDDDEAALTIRWDTAQRLFDGARAEAYQLCRAEGLEMLQPRGLPRGDDFRRVATHGQKTLMALLEERINIDKTAVTMAVGYVTPVARTKIKSNLEAAYLDGLDALRASLYHWALHNLQAFSSLGIFTEQSAMSALSDLEASVIREYIEHALKPYMQEFAKLYAAVDVMPEDPTVYAKVRHYFDAKPAVH